MSASISDSPRAPAAVTTSFVSGVLRAKFETPAIDERESHQIAREVGLAVAEARKRGAVKALVLDLSEVRAITSLGLGMVINLHHIAAEAGASTIAIGMTRELTDLFRMMRIDRLCTIVLNEADLRKVLAARG